MITYALVIAAVAGGLSLLLDGGWLTAAVFVGVLAVGLVRARAA